MRFVTYFTVDKDGYLQEECGDRHVVILDARNQLFTSIQDAKKFNGFRRPVYDAFQIFQGRNFLDSKPITDIIPL